MKLVRYGSPGREKPGIIDADGKIRDLSRIVKDIDGAMLASGGYPWTVIRVEEMVDTTFTAASFFPKFDLAALRPHLGWLAPRYYIPERDALVFSMHAWVVKTGRHTVLIDTCVGNGKDRMPRAHWDHMNTPFLERLRATGTAPEDVDYVMCTHLHADHVGWNTMLRDGRWVPTFPKARYLFARVEYEHWSKNPDPSPIRRNAFYDSVLPVVEAGRLLDARPGRVLRRRR